MFNIEADGIVIIDTIAALVLPAVDLRTADCHRIGQLKIHIAKSWIIYSQYYYDDDDFAAVIDSCSGMGFCCYFVFFFRASSYQLKLIFSKV